jgi:hypothetical protein
MERTIADFHQDEHGDWVADLDCGHTRHVRHNPPWILRPWVLTEEGRAQFIGQKLNCVKCDTHRRSPRNKEAS